MERTFQTGNSWVETKKLKGSVSLRNQKKTSVSKGESSSDIILEK